MGNFLSCVGTRSESEDYDLSSLRSKNLPMIWITGQPNTGKKTLGLLLKEKYEFEYINISDLLTQEATKETKRAQTVSDALTASKKISDSIVMDLLKEALLVSTNNKGFLIANFPKTAKQAERFIREIANVNFIYYFYSEVPLLISRAEAKLGASVDAETLRRDIAIGTRDLKMCLGRFTLKIESVNTSGLPEESFVKAENALIKRINIRPIKTEQDYVQPQNNQVKTTIPAAPPMTYVDEQGRKELNLIITPVSDEADKKEEKEKSENSDDKLRKKKAGDLEISTENDIVQSDKNEKTSSKSNVKPDETQPNKREENKDNNSTNASKGEESDEDEEMVKLNELEQGQEDDESVSSEF